MYLIMFRRKKDFLNAIFNLRKDKLWKKSYFLVIDAFLGYTDLNNGLSCVSES